MTSSSKETTATQANKAIRYIAITGAVLLGLQILASIVGYTVGLIEKSL
jgi:hypothetical protein